MTMAEGEAGGFKCHERERAERRLHHKNEGYPGFPSLVHSLGVGEVVTPAIVERDRGPLRREPTNASAKHGQRGEDHFD